jgi:hypothetical protein
MFDITSLGVDETATCDLNTADDTPLINEDKKQCSVTVYGPGSAQYAAAEAKRQNRLLERLRRKGKTEMSAEEQRAESAEFLAAITVSFNEFGYPPAGDATGKDLFRALYMDRKIGFITDQVQKFVGDWGNFTGSSATS